MTERLWIPYLRDHPREKPNEVLKDPTMPDLNGDTILHRILEWDRCAKKSCKETSELMRILMRATECKDLVDDDGFTPLGRAVENNQNSLVKVLVEEGANPFFREAEGMETPIEIAERCGNKEAIQIFRNH